MLTIITSKLRQDVKMASIRKRGDKWLVEICVNGKRKGKTFESKLEANRWAAMAESDMHQQGSDNIPKDKTFRDLLERYSRDVSINKRSVKWEQKRITFFQSFSIADVKLTELSEVHVYQWRDSRLKDISPSSVGRDWGILSNACSIAVKEWKWLKVNPFSNVKKPTPAQARTRRISDDEIALISDCIGYDDKCELNSNPLLTMAAFHFALETGMRMGEILALRWGDIHDKHAHLPKTKNGYARDVPINAKARAILARLNKDSDTCFRIKVKIVDATFRRYRDKVGIKDLHFHDSRREALSRMAKVVPVQMLAKISGHRDLRVLLNTYYAPKVEDITAYFD
jgi:integrase